MALPDFTMRQLLEAGVHFGHQKHRWNPRMENFIFGLRNNVHIIDLAQTVPLLHQALKVVSDTVAGGGRVLLVGTKRQAQTSVSDAARRSAQYFVNARWLGGMLTNWKTISHSIQRLRKLEEMLGGEAQGLTKKERLFLSRERDKLERNLGGIKDMGGIPDLLFVIDTNREAIAIQEAHRLNIPVAAVLDTNCDPTGITHPIPGNDDAARAIDLYCGLVARAAIDGISRAQGAMGYDTGEAVEVLQEEPALAAEVATVEAAAAAEPVVVEAAAEAEPVVEEAAAAAEPVVVEAAAEAEPAAEEAAAAAEPVVVEAAAEAEPVAVEAAAAAEPVVVEAAATAEPVAEEAAAEEAAAEAEPVAGEAAADEAEPAAEVTESAAEDAEAVAETAEKSEPETAKEKPAKEDDGVVALFETPEGEADDLKKINGVGPVIETKLNALGVTKFAQIAAFSAEDIERVDAVLNFKGRIERESWIDQAKKLEAGEA